MGRFLKYRSGLLTFLFAVGIIIVYKTVDNFNFIFAFFAKVVSAVSPFITGFIIAYLLNMPIKKLMNVYDKSRIKGIRKAKKPLAVAGVYLLALFLVFVILRMVIPAIYKNLLDLYYNIPYYFDRISEDINALQEKFGIEMVKLDEESAISAVQGFLANMKVTELGRYAQGVINITSGVIDVFIAIIASIYMISDKSLISGQIKRFLNAFFKESMVDAVIGYAGRVNVIFTKYIISVVIDGGVMGILAAVVMSILKVKYAVMLGLIIGVSNLIPYFGAIVSIFVTIVVTLITGGWVQALWVAVLLMVLQQIDGNLIGPRIMGNMLKARPLLIIFAVTLGGGLFGVWGMVLSVPVVMVLKMIMGDIIEAKEKKKSVCKTAEDAE